MLLLRYLLFKIFYLNLVILLTGMIREDPSIKVSLIQERINNEFAYKVLYKKAWMAKQKAIALEYGDWEESYVKLSSWLTHMRNHSPGSYFQILHDDFIVGNTVSANTVSFIECFGLLVNVKRFSSIVSQSYKLTAHTYTANIMGPS